VGRSFIQFAAKGLLNTAQYCADRGCLVSSNMLRKVAVVVISTPNGVTNIRRKR
jgi:hypothetical protein